MVILVDANVVIDYILNREPSCKSAGKVMKICSQKENSGFIALHSVSIIWYVLRRIPDAERREWMKRILNILKVVSITHDEVLKAIAMDSFKDFEDCLQDRSAVAIQAQYIITSNTKDFSESMIKAITPEAFCEKYA
ncbi:PIN domain-containing protein [Lachnospiraceae bacterium 62-26]|jgi:predicted nucleic-acid-binding protein